MVEREGATFAGEDSRPAQTLAEGGGEVAEQEPVAGDFQCGFAVDFVNDGSWLVCPFRCGLHFKISGLK